jgi:hypothetical protein
LATAALAARVEAFYAAAAPFECDFRVGAVSKGQTRSWQMHVLFDRPGEWLATLSGGSVVAVHSGVMTIYDAATGQQTSNPVSTAFCPAALAYAAALSRQLLLHASDQANATTLLNARPLARSSLSDVFFFVKPSGEVETTAVILPGGEWQSFKALQCTTSLPPPPSSIFQTPPPTPLPGTPSSSFLSDIRPLLTTLP